MSQTPAVSLLLLALVMLWFRPVWGLWLVALLALRPQAMPVPPAPVEQDAALRTRVERVLPGEGSGFWGYVLVAKDGREVVARGYGAERPREAGSPPVSGRSLFDIGSISKPLTATAVMLLAERGRLRLDDPIEMYDPGERAALRPSGITVRHLLSHSSGKPHAIRPYDEPELAKAFAEVLNGKSTAKPGAVFQYNNGGYCVLAGVVQQASGEPFDDFLREQVLLRMGMRSSGVPAHKALLDAEHATRRGERPGVTALDHPWGWGGRGCTGVITCGDDLLAWDRAIRESSLLTAASLDAMHAPLIPTGRDDQSSYGLGWFVTTLPAGSVRLSHSGGCFGYRSELRRYPGPGLLIVVLTSDQSDPRAIADQLERAALAAP